MTTKAYIIMFAAITLMIVTGLGYDCGQLSPYCPIKHNGPHLN